MISLKARELPAMFSTLNKLVELNALSVDPARNRKLKYWAYRFSKKFEVEYASYLKNRDDILLEFCEKDNDGNPIKEANNRVKIPDEKILEYNIAISELGNTDIAIEFDKITINVNELPEEMTVSMLLSLDSAIEIIEEEESLPNEAK